MRIKTRGIKHDCLGTKSPHGNINTTFLHLQPQWKSFCSFLPLIITPFPRRRLLPPALILQQAPLLYVSRLNDKIKPPGLSTHGHQTVSLKQLFPPHLPERKGDHKQWKYYSQRVTFSFYTGHLITKSMFLWSDMDQKQQRYKNYCHLINIFFNLRVGELRSVCSPCCMVLNPDVFFNVQNKILKRTQLNPCSHFINTVLIFGPICLMSKFQNVIFN